MRVGEFLMALQAAAAKEAAARGKAGDEDVDVANPAPVVAAETPVAGTVQPNAAVKEDVVTTTKPEVVAETPKRPDTPAPWSSPRHSSPTRPSTLSNAPTTSSSAKGKAKGKRPSLTIQIPKRPDTPAPPLFTQADVYATSAEVINVRGVGAGWLARARRDSGLARSPEGRPSLEAASAVAASSDGRHVEQDGKGVLLLGGSSSCSQSSKLVLDSLFLHHGRYSC